MLGLRFGRDNASCHSPGQDADGRRTEAPARSGGGLILAFRIRLVSMTSTNSLSLILRRLDEVESRLDRMLQELRTLHTPAAIGYSVRRGNFPKKD